MWGNVAEKNLCVNQVSHSFERYPYPMLDCRPLTTGLNVMTDLPTADAAPSSEFRAILKQFVPNREHQDYYIPGGLEGKIVLDPMMGGG